MVWTIEKFENDCGMQQCGLRDREPGSATWESAKVNQEVEGVWEEE